MSCCFSTTMLAVVIPLAFRLFCSTLRSLYLTFSLHLFSPIRFLRLFFIPIYTIPSRRRLHNCANLSHESDDPFFIRALLVPLRS